MNYLTFDHPCHQFFILFWRGFLAACFTTFDFVHKNRTFRTLSSIFFSAFFEWGMSSQVNCSHFRDAGFIGKNDTAFEANFAAQWTDYLVLDFSNSLTLPCPLCFQKCSWKLPKSWKHEGLSGNIKDHLKAGTPLMFSNFAKTWKHKGMALYFKFECSRTFDF